MTDEKRQEMRARLHKLWDDYEDGKISAMYCAEMMAITHRFYGHTTNTTVADCLTFIDKNLDEPAAPASVTGNYQVTKVIDGIKMGYRIGGTQRWVSQADYASRFWKSDAEALLEMLGDPEVYIELI